MDDASTRAMHKVGIPLFDPEFQALLVNHGFPAAMAYLITRYGLLEDEARFTWDWMAKVLASATGG